MSKIISAVYACLSYNIGRYEMIKVMDSIWKSPSLFVMIIWWPSSERISLDAGERSLSTFLSSTRQQ